MDIKKGKCDGRIYDVVAYENYPPENREIFQHLAVEKDGILYPERSSNDMSKPGIYRTAPITIRVDPVTEDDKIEYSSNNIIDLDCDNMRELISQSDKLKELEKDILTDADAIYNAPIDQDDTPELAGLKEAINAKNIDINKYAHRFGENFQNDRRALNKNNITLEKMKRFFTHLDMEATLTIKDKDGDIANPMNKVIVVDITGEGN